MSESSSDPRLKRICVFCGSSPGHAPIYTAAARAFGKHLANNGTGLVYGGASVGLMGAVADAVMDNGGEVACLANIALGAAITVSPKGHASKLAPPLSPVFEN